MAETINLGGKDMHILVNFVKVKVRLKISCSCVYILHPKSDVQPKGKHFRPITSRFTVQIFGCSEVI